jgi:uncharacterized protein (DUF2384 family)
MSATAFDLAHPELVAHELDEANRRLARQAVAPASVLGLVEAVCDEIGNTSREQLSGVGVEPDAWIEIQRAALRAQRVVLGGDKDDRQQRRRLRLLIEELRFRLARLAEDEQVSDERPIDDVVRWLDNVLSLPQAAKARLCRVGERTYQRWVSETDPGHPTGDDERRVRLLARLVTDLRYVLTAVGAAEWLEREHPALGDRVPLDLLDEPDPSALSALFSLVAAARAGAAA